MWLLHLMYPPRLPRRVACGLVAAWPLLARSLAAALLAGWLAGWLEWLSDKIMSRTRNRVAAVPIVPAFGSGRAERGRQEGTAA